jgi:hypothetical protein
LDGLGYIIQNQLELVFEKIFSKRKFLEEEVKKGEEIKLTCKSSGQHRLLEIEAVLVVNCNVFVSEISQVVSLNSCESSSHTCLVEAVVVSGALFKYLGRFHLV